jgi:hypothetical protein
MKNLLVLSLFFVSVFSFAQDISAITLDGKKVILKPNKTWSYDESKIETKNNCAVEQGFKESKGDSKNQSFLKMTDATVSDLKKHISLDRGCKITDIILTNLSEQKGNGIYIVCVNGNEYKYRRSGSVFYRDGDAPLKLN